MRYWDSSALLPLLVHEDVSHRADELLGDDPSIVTWWGSAVECASALARREREELLAPDDATAALARLRTASAAWTEVPATPIVREQAMRLVRVHPIRAGDAMQLAAAIVAADFQSSLLEIVTFDRRLAGAAEREGFTVLR